MAIVHDRHGWRDTNDPKHYPSEEEILLSIESVTRQLRSQFNRPNDVHSGTRTKPKPTLDQLDRWGTA